MVNMGTELQSTKKKSQPRLHKRLSQSAISNILTPSKSYRSALWVPSSRGPLHSYTTPLFLRFAAYST